MRPSVSWAISWQIDRDGSGYISPEELRYVVCNTGEKFTQSEAEELIGMFDVNKDGELSWEEFVTFIKSSIMEEEEDEKLITTEKAEEITETNKDIENNKL
ncbi:Calmodulin [Exaiptasia diaphana]|nr:Calmodulin [Exaiptasia diaphana]